MCAAVTRPLQHAATGGCAAALHSLDATGITYLHHQEEAEKMV